MSDRPLPVIAKLNRVKGDPRPCPDCLGEEYVLAQAAPNGATITLRHDPGCPRYPALRAEQDCAL